MRAVSFDIETAKVLPAGVTDLLAHAPLGIACAAAVRSDAPAAPVIWSGQPQLDRQQARALVADLSAWAAAGFTIVTWNGCSFDFRVLAEESGLWQECGALALAHVDLMLIVSFMKGYYLGLDKALAGAGLAGKIKQVTLRDGRTVGGIGGALAPALWAAGECDAVLAYLVQDVTQLLSLAESVERTRRIQWTSQRGAPAQVEVPRLLSVRECLALPLPDTSWMSHPVSRDSFVGWIPGLR